MSEESPKKNLYVYRTHFWNKFIQSQWESLCRDVGPEHCFLLFDDSKNPVPDYFHSHQVMRCRQVIHGESSLSSIRVIAINQKECEDMNRLHKCNKEQVESQLVLFFLSCPVRDFDFLWLLEYDVYCDGNWLSTLERANSYHQDFLSVDVFEYKEEPLWGHWFKMYGRIRLKPSISDRVKCFFPITRFSQRFLSQLLQCIGRLSGFCEVYIPTLAKKLGLSYANVPKSMLGEMFVYSDSKEVIPPQKKDDTLYHPIVRLE